ncbi:hypothetical protein FACS189454_06170 [Planctomycetales bacterium]|nr:hypothetical protein FACS189454_06170 [Planctomycetales bacterium]
MQTIERGDRWENENEIAQKYLAQMNGIYRNGKLWGKPVDGLLESQMEDTDLLLSSRSSNTWGPLRLDHVYEFSTLALAVRAQTGNDPKIWFSDLRNPQNAKAGTATAAIREEVRTTIWNPQYIEALQQEGSGAAATLVEPIRNLYGWNVVQPSSVDSSLWEETYQVYIEDKHQLNMKEYFAKKNPFAFQDLTAIMLETIRKGLWTPAPEIVENLAKIHTDIVAEHGAGCSYETCANSKLHDFIGQQAPPTSVENYRLALDAVLQSGKPLPEVEGIQLETTETSTSVTEHQTDTAPFLVGLIFVCGAVILLTGFFVRFS